MATYKPARIKDGTSWGERLSGFAIIFVFGFAFAAAGFVAGVAPEWTFDRKPDGVYLTGTNTFAGLAFFSKTIGPVKDVRTADNSRNDRRDSMKERQRRARQKSVAVTDQSGKEMRWSREEDWRMMDDFVDGNAPSLTVVDTPPLWRACLSWAGLILGGLIWVGAVKDLILGPKTSTGAPRHPGRLP